jgi:hypothetical protein
MSSYHEDRKQDQLTWKARTLPHVEEPGLWQNQPYHHILPYRYREENLWNGIRANGLFRLETYLSPRKIQPHTGRDNLLSSWTLAANLYFAFGQSVEGQAILAGFLAQVIDARIAAVTAVELEWEHKDDSLKPPALLGEKDGSRGTKQTSPDVAFEVVLKDGSTGVILTEVKFTEHNFYACSIRKQLSPQRVSDTCDDLSKLKQNPCGDCGQHTAKSRRYWDHLANVFEWAAPLNRCPAATAGYQLFRQQALAEGLAKESEMTLVVSSLAYDERNTGLLRSLRSTATRNTPNPLEDVRTGWPQLFKSTAKSQFKAFSHQSWVEFVRQAKGAPAWCGEWAEYVGDRYGF